MKKLIVAALAVSLAPAVACAEVWNVSEGPQAKVKGVWNVTLTGADVSGKATMAGLTGNTLTYTVSGKKKDDGFVLRRVKASDSAECTYVGKPQADGSIAGAAICNGQSTPWMVKRGS